MTKSIYVGAARETIRCVWSGHRKLSLFVSFEQLRVIQNSRWTRRHGRAVLEGAELGQCSVEVVQIVVEVEHWISAWTKTNFRR